MKIAIYNTCFASMGGGERRTAALAAHLRASHEVTLFVQTPVDYSLVEHNFGIDLSNVEIVALEGKDHLQTLTDIRPDLFINNSYGSNLPCPAPAGIYMCMFPHGDRVDLSSYDVVTANSQFTASWIERKWGYKPEIVYSACESMGPPDPKENIILNVGRYFADGNDGRNHKRQEIILSAFVEMIRRRPLDWMIRRRPVDWRLHFVGNVGPDAEDRDFLERLRAAARNHPITISVALDFRHLRQEYRRASIYWHATGYGRSEELEPSTHEHFGMSIVEAMSAGCVPLVFNSGGPREIVRSGRNGILWNDLDELRRSTLDIIADPKRLKGMSLAAIQDSERFNARNYLMRMDAIIANCASGKV